MDANSGKSCSERTSVISRTRSTSAGRYASFLCRDEGEVREKMKQLGLVALTLARHISN
jgi:hypothetical protein